MDEVRIVRLQPGDDRARFESCGRIHAAEVPGGFLVRLGGRFLTALYRHLSGSRHAFLFAALQGNEVAGFIAGSLDTRGLYREFLFRNPFTLALALLPLAFSPSAWKRVYETWRYPSQKLGADLPGCEVLNFCVTAGRQGQGVGGRLFAAFCNEFRERAVPAIRIVTGADQEKAHRFYEAKGSEQAGDIEVHEGTNSRVYVHRLEAGE